MITPMSAIRFCGVLLFTYIFVKLWSMPSGLLAGAALAMIVLP